MNEKTSLSPTYFDEIYAASDDPWNFETSEYEREKYQTTLASLPKERYANALEIGCSIGVLTQKLAARCDKLLSVDVAEKALSTAKKRCENLGNVDFQIMRVPEQFPDENFDLILISEVGYYLSVEDWARTQTLIIQHLKQNGNVILIHWTNFVHDYPQTGDAVHDSFKALTAKSLSHLSERREENYRLDVFERF